MTPKRRDVLKLLSAGAVASSARAQAPPQSGAQPNILVIMADQHRAGLTRAGGFPLDTMPALDGLAARGVAFDRAYTTAPLCVPARISLLTGRWASSYGSRARSYSSPFPIMSNVSFQSPRRTILIEPLCVTGFSSS